MRVLLFNERAGREKIETCRGGTGKIHRDKRDLHWTTGVASRVMSTVYDFYVAPTTASTTNSKTSTFDLQPSTSSYLEEAFSNDDDETLTKMPMFTFSPISA